MGHRIGARRFQRAGLLLAGAALLLAGCDAVQSPHATSTATGTANAAPITLTWQVAAPVPATSPAPTTSPVPEAPTLPFTFAVAPSDGRVTYGCSISESSDHMTALVLSTQDSGRSWSKGVTLPYLSVLSGCAIQVDEANPRRVAVWLNTATMGASPGDASAVAYLSLDGGATWRALPKVGPHVIFSVASYGDAIYVAGGGLNASGAELRDVWVSRDSGASWQALGATDLSPNPHLWINPKTGEMIGTNEYDVVPTLWRSKNSGASWTRLNVPRVAVSGGEQTNIVAPNGSGWRICAVGTGATNSLTCSVDLGATWTSKTALNPSQYSPKGFTFVAPVYVYAIADNGAVLATYNDVLSGNQFEFLPPGSAVWARLNTPPGASASGALPVYTTGPGNGMLWIPGGGAAAFPFATAAYP